jgi:hypothetical protein
MRGRRSLACAIWFGCLSACPEQPAPPQDDADQQRLMAEVDAIHARYRTVIDGFWSALATGQAASAYALLAPAYRNQVSEESFVRRIARNQNFARAPSVKVLGTSSQVGSARVRCVLGEPGLGEVFFVEGPAGPRISALNIAGAPALPQPE